MSFIFYLYFDSDNFDQFGSVGGKFVKSFVFDFFELVGYQVGSKNWRKMFFS